MSRDSAFKKTPPLGGVLFSALMLSKPMKRPCRKPMTPPCAKLFLDARTQNAWQPKDVPDNLLRQLVDIMKMGPTSANCPPARFVFVKSKEAKERLKPLLSEGNREKTMPAPVCAIIGYDLSSTSTCRGYFRTRP